MVVCFMGRPGGGKTYMVVKRILDIVKTGRTVYTNVDGFDDPLIQEAHKAYTGLDDYEYFKRVHFIEPHQVKDCFHELPFGALLVIDEVHKFFGNRDWNTEANKEFCNWASTHRHHGYDVYLVTQDIEKNDKNIRSLIEWTYEYRKVNFVGSAVKNQFLEYVYMGADVGKSWKTNRRTYNKQIFSCYKSYVAQDVKELGLGKHINIFMHPVFFIIPIILGVTIYMVFFKSSLATGDLFGSKKVQQTILEGRKKIVDKENSLKGPGGPGSNLGPGPGSKFFTGGKQVNDKMFEFHDKVDVPVGIVKGVSKGSDCRSTGVVETDEGRIDYKTCGNEAVTFMNGQEIGRRASSVASGSSRGEVPNGYNTPIHNGAPGSRPGVITVPAGHIPKSVYPPGEVGIHNETVKDHVEKENM